MTVLEATGHLYNWFQESTSFSLEKDFIKVIPITEHPERDRAAFLCALKEFEEGKVVSRSKVDDIEYWILEKPFDQYTQTVTVSPDLCLTLSAIVNNFCESVGNDSDLCDPTNVKEDDFKNLLYIANLLITEKKIDLEKEES